MGVPACLRVGVTALLVATSVAFGPVAAAQPTSVAGKIVFLDPGHNGVNNSANSVQVPTGRGGTKDCQASGTSSDGGLTEHAFTWDTVLRIKQALMALNVRVAMSRGDDTSQGPCVDQRAALANAVTPDAIVSVHADGGPASGRGFHILYSDPPLNDAQAGAAVQFAQLMADQLSQAGIPESTYVGSNGLMGRSDIAGLNLAQYPSILVELGNMKNSVDSELMASAEGRQLYANAVVKGIVAYLAGS
ncbi:MAG: Rv3717 family N-acetylmuramoyl-L-alanine amidase [Mycobacterium sp.]